MTDGPAQKKPKRRRRGGGGGGGGGGANGQNGQNHQNGQHKGQGQGQKAKRPDLWRPVPQLAEPRPITPADDPTALVWSLGDLPLQGQGENAKHYVSKVVERAAMLATALAHSAGLVAEPEPDE